MRLPRSITMIGLVSLARHFTPLKLQACSFLQSFTLLLYPDQVIVAKEEIAHQGMAGYCSLVCSLNNLLGHLKSSCTFNV